MISGDGVEVQHLTNGILLDLQIKFEKLTIPNGFLQSDFCSLGKIVDVRLRYGFQAPQHGTPWREEC